jgi:hypothetical protein
VAGPDEMQALGELDLTVAAAGSPTMRHPAVVEPPAEVDRKVERALAKYTWLSPPLVELWVDAAASSFGGGPRRARGLYLREGCSSRAGVARPISLASAVSVFSSIGAETTMSNARALAIVVRAVS